MPRRFPAKRLPVLFVHGHGFEEATSYQDNWQEDPTGTSLTSFQQTLLLNEDLGVEEYYISLPNQDDRSITADAADIRDAVNLILERHDPDFDHTDANSTTHVKVVIIAYSQGTISTRLYLKSLCVRDSRCQAHDAVPGLDPPLQQDFRPVSEFIAIAPPNHGISAPGFALTGDPTLATKQLYDGFKPDIGSLMQCTDSFNESLATNYISTLNGHAMADTVGVDNDEFYPSEAPGSRPNIDPDTDKANPPTRGILYVTLFANSNRDFVGGMTPASECNPRDGRTLARNLAPDAINIEVPEISGTLKSVVHANTVHTPRVICLALYAATHHRAPPADLNCGSGAVPVIPLPPRAAAMLTLDFSGSMSAPACHESNPGCGDTRASILKEAVVLFVELWSAVGMPDDRIGVTYFRTNVDQFHHSTSGEALPKLSAARSEIITDVASPTQTPSNGTAMGGGLQLAIGALSDSSDVDIRRVILFTDGMQNVNPMVRTLNDQLVIDNQSGRQNSNITPTVPPIVLDKSSGIAVDTIGLGAQDSFAGLLEDIALATGGRTKTTIEIELLRRFFVEELINALRGFSPQLVAYRRGAVAARGSAEAFVIESGVRKVVLKLSWKRGDSMDFAVMKDGVDVTADGRIISGAFYKIFVINLPKKGKNRIAAGGNWQMRIKGKRAAAYEAAAIVDGGGISYDAVFKAKRAKVGDPLELVVRLAAGSKPIGDSARVTARLMIPTTSVRDLITPNPPKEPPAFEAGMTLGERQLLALPQDPEKWAKLRPKRQTVVLRRSGNGAFSTRLHPQVPGIYTAVVTIDGEAAKIGKFSRTMTATAVVRPTEPAEPRK